RAAGRRVRGRAEGGRAPRGARSGRRTGGARAARSAAGGMARGAAAHGAGAQADPLRRIQSPMITAGSPSPGDVGGRRLHAHARPLRWEPVVRRARQSGLPIRTYARQHGINPNTLAWWNWRLSDDLAESAFVEVTV